MFLHNISVHKFVIYIIQFQPFLVLFHFPNGHYQQKYEYVYTVL